MVNPDQYKVNELTVMWVLEYKRFSFSLESDKVTYHSSLVAWVENNSFKRCLNLWEIGFVECQKRKKEENIQRVPKITNMLVKGSV